MSPLTGVLSEAWGLYRRHARHFLLLSFAIYLVLAAVAALFSAFLGTTGQFLSDVLNVFGVYLLQAALVKAVQDVRDGRAGLSLRETVGAALPSLWGVALASILAAIAIAVGFFLVIVPGLILATYLSLIVPCIVIGGAGALGSFGKSWRTVRGNGWHVFGTYVMVFLLLILANIVIAVVLSFLPAAARDFLAEVVAGTLIAPFVAAVVTLVYYRLTAARDKPAEPAARAPGAPGAPGEQF